MDIFQNSIRANATLISLDIQENISENIFQITVVDNGDGMTSDMIEHVTDPFMTTRTTRKVGLGLSLFKQNAERTGGFLSIESELGIGTKVKTQFVHDNIDRPVSGDIAATVLLTATAHPEIEMVYQHTINDKTYCFSTTEVKEALGSIPINDPMVYPYLHEMISENIKDISI
jgi:hypothetical protein